MLTNREPEPVQIIVEENKLLLERIKLCLNFLWEEEKKIRENEIRKSKKQKTTEDLNVGDWVLRRKQKEERTCKLDSLWTGPFKIIKVLGKGGYQIADINGKQHTVNRKDLSLVEDVDEKVD